MNKNKSLIIQLIVQDMKHEQLIGGLSNLGLQPDLHRLDICLIVADLMGLSDTNMPSDWMETYMDFLGHAECYEITGDGKNLVPLAEVCYSFLMKCVERSEVAG